ncbi:MAG: peptidase S16 [Alphaproteobacteria bacterium]|nr:peptidase S16 [Alphaproteobacteria bacterium]
MAETARRQRSAALPETLPLFPLPGVLLLPRGRLPLNIFEPRYLAMVEDALKAERLIGMIQPADAEASLAPDPARQPAELFRVGCAGRMTQFGETDDGRYLITLTGVSRFAIAEELPLTEGGYRRARVDWARYAEDRGETEARAIDRDALLAALRHYFKRRKLSANWDAVTSAADDALVTALAMVCPFEAREKQALLESAGLAERAALLLALFHIGAAHDGDGDAKLQ